jgi:CoA:oxalate CoA-transferase
LQAALEPLLARHGAADWLAKLEAASVPCAPVQTVAEAVRHPQVAARRMVVGIPDPAIGTLWVAGNPVKIADVPEATSHRTAPDLDADRGAILAGLRGRA